MDIPPSTRAGSSQGKSSLPSVNVNAIYNLHELLLCNTDKSITFAVYKGHIHHKIYIHAYIHVNNNNNNNNNNNIIDKSMIIVVKCNIM